MATVATPHIRLDEKGVAWIDDTNVKVIEVIRDWMAHGSSPLEMHIQFPHLSLAQIHAAFTYYYDHKAELDADIERRERLAEAMEAQAEETPFVKRMRAAGKLP